MTTGADLPDDILEAARVINLLREKRFPSREERENLNRAKLRIAYWVCRNEKILATRENLSYILGSDASEIMGAYDKYLEKDAMQEAARTRKKRKADSQFWGK